MRHLMQLNPYFKRYAHLLCFGILCVATSTVLATYQGVIIRNLTNAVCNSTPKTHSIFIYGFLQILGLALLSGVFMFLMRQTIIVMSRHIEYDQKNQLYLKFQELKPQQIQTYTTGDLMNRIAEDVSRVRMYTGPAIMYIVNTIVTVITVLIFMLSISSSLTLLVFLPLPLLSIFIYKISIQIQKLSHKSQSDLGLITSKAQESFNAIRLIKAYAMERETQIEMQQQSEAYRKSAVALAFRESLFGPLMTLMIGLSVWLTIWQGGILLSKHQIEPGNITEFILYVFRLTWPFASIGWVSALIQRASASQERINTLLHLPTPDANDAKRSIMEFESIEFKNLSYSYPETPHAALHNITMSISKNSIIGITGPMGSGKSTWVNIITGQLACSDNSLFLNNMCVNTVKQRNWRDIISIVPQDIFLFSDTIFENIAFGAIQNVSQSEIIEAAKIAQLHDTVMQFKDGYQTLVGERGVMLSGGQKQRLAIARALVRKSKVLILDDCINALDHVTEQALMQRLKHMNRFECIIIISHRLTQIQHTQCIYYFEQGSITECGTHQDLLDKQGSYAQLYALQNEL
ncbi:MAG: ABC transporter ATP-binding protein [Bacteroidia bacterium]|jgi:ATP-binding cassette, subfamily B, multidrug efflux pump